jgi:hypothetical protein
MKPPIDADIIMPVTTPNDVTLNIARVSIRTCRATTGGRLWVVHNNTDCQGKREELKKECELLGANYLYMDGPFSTSKTFNQMFDRTTGEYIAFSSGDIICFDNWLENVIEHFKAHPDYLVLSPFQFATDHPACGRQTMEHENRIQNTGNPAGPVLVFKRSNCFRWDENLPLWEVDADLLIHIQRSGSHAAYCCNARVDHLYSGYVRNIDMHKHFGFEGDIHQNFYGKQTQHFKNKWGIK